MILYRRKHSDMAEHEPLPYIKLASYFIAVLGGKRKLIGINTVFYNLKISVSENEMSRRIGARQSDIGKLVYSGFI